MPTDRPRYMLTGTENLEAALERARSRWPEDGARPTRLLIRLVEVGDTALAERDSDTVRRRRAAIARTSGIFSDLYPDGYLEELRLDWPE